MAAPCPWKPGDLTVTASPRWGHSQLKGATGGTLTILSTDPRWSDYAAEAVAGHAALLAERDRLRGTLARIADYATDGATRYLAREALGLDTDPTEIVAAFRRVERGD